MVTSKSDPNPEGGVRRSKEQQTAACEKLLRVQTNLFFCSNTML